MRLVRRSDRAASARTGRTAILGQDGLGAIGWDVVVVAFMRLLAMAWVAQAMVQWSAMLLPPGSVLHGATLARGAAVVAFAVLDPVAAVGLWLATPWGGVIWLVAATAQVLVAVAIPGFFAPAWIGVNSVLIVLYFLLTWLAARSSRSRRAHS